MTDPPNDAATIRVSGARPRGALWTSIVVGLLFALVGTLFLVKVVGGSGTPKDVTSLTESSATVIHAVTSIPPAVFDTVGIRSPVVPLIAPVPTSSSAPLYFTAPNGERLPGVLYVGTEYCSFCAAERWALIAALSRFGTFNTLYDMESSDTDFAPSTKTFTFYTTTFTSSRVVFRAFELQSGVPTATGHRRLMTLRRHERAILRSLDPTMTYPFVDVGNRVVTMQGAFSPQTLAGLSREEIAAKLSDPTDPITEAIVASANYLSAAICASDRQRPASVCASRGVVEAAAALHLARDAR